MQPIRIHFYDRKQGIYQYFKNELLRRTAAGVSTKRIERHKRRGMNPLALLWSAFPLWRAWSASGGLVRLWRIQYFMGAYEALLYRSEKK